MSTSSITLETNRLRRGLFVAALDRPWEGTGFLFQGFLVETDEELSALRDNCSWVIVDLGRSLPDAARDFAVPASEAPEDRARGRRTRRIAGVGAASPPVNAGPTAAFDPKSRQARSERAQLLKKRTSNRYTALPDAQRPAEVPGGEPLVRYVDDAESLASDLPRAKAAATAARSSLATFAQEILTRGELQVQRIEEAASDLTECIVENPNALLWLTCARERDVSTYTHNITVAVYLLTLGRHLGYPPPRLVEFATIGMLLDIGKLFVDRALLSKAGRLSEEELRAVQQHVQLGLAALAPAGELSQTIVDGIAQHHERIDGSGYPNALLGSAISMEGKMAAIADSFTAMTSPRTYAPVMTAYQALRELYRQAGTHFQESLIDRFVEAIGIFPVGAMVELSSGEVAVVVRHNRQRRLEPCVLVLTGKDRQLLDSPFEIDLLTQAHLSVDHKLARIARALQPGEFDFDLSELYLR